MADQGTFVAKFCTCSSFNPVHPLFVGVHPRHAVILAGDKVENGSVLSILPPKRSQGVETNTELFVCLQLDDRVCMRTDDAIGGSMTVLHTSKFFHSHYKIDPDAEVLIRSVRTFPLQKVIIGARTRASYAWSKGHGFSTGMLVCSCKQKILARTGDILLTPLANMVNGKDSKDYDEVFQLCANLITLECQPTMQGIITVHTSIIVLPLEHDSHEDDNVNKTGTHLPSVNKITQPALLSDFTACMRTIDFASSLLRLRPMEHIENFNALSLLKSSRQFNRIVKTRLKLRPVVLPQYSDFMDILQQEEVDEVHQADLVECIGVTTTTLQQLNVYNGGWASVEIFSDSAGEIQGLIDGPPPQNQEVKFSIDGETNNESVSKHTIKSHIVKVFVVEECQTDYSSPIDYKENQKISVRDDCVYISPLLWFNIQHHPSSLIQPDCKLSVQSACIDTTQPESNNSIPFVKSLHIAMVKSPLYSIYGKFDEAVRKYFSPVRFVSLGDTICVHPTGDVDQISDASENPISNTVPDCIYYKIVKLDPLVDNATVYRADTQHTTVFQEASVSSYIPVTMDAYHNNSLDPIWKSPVPAGLCKYVNMIEEYLMTFLQPKFGSHKILPCILLSGASGIGKTTVIRSLSRCLNLHVMTVNCHDLCGDTSASSEAKIKNAFHKASVCSPCILHLRNVEVLAKDKDGTSEDTRVTNSLSNTISSYTQQEDQYPLVVIATTSIPKQVSPDIYSCFLHHFPMEVPTEDERFEILKKLCRVSPLARDVSLGHLAKKTAGMVLGDLHALVATTKRTTYKRIIQSCSVGSRLCLQEEKDLCSAGLQIQMKDFELALEHLQSAHSDVIGAPKVPNVTWEDVGGLTEVKREIIDTVQFPLEHPELMSLGMRRSGILFYGPPGTGKTLLAKAVANECELNFLSVKGPELINMYVGQSEGNVREVFQRARSASPCVIFFDELDSLAPNRGRSGDSGGVMDRVVSQLLAELDGLHESCNVVVIGATNRPDLLDPALLRPGRFDKLLYLGVSQDKKSQLRILKALTRKFHLSASCKLEDIVEKCPMNLTGADFYSLCSDAMLNAMKRKIQQLQQEENPASQATVEVEVEPKDFLTAVECLTPSVSEDELKHYQSVQQQFRQ
ncbi:peroxisomal ATPase PEX6-like [Ptychodera flava]|uniref:peroxisomal ATPase PEX6-like n=1 Tax=Ptychodera flava TaxID=63121 RepID=UPI003969E39D